MLSVLNKIFLTGKCLSSLLVISYVDVFEFTFLLWGPTIKIFAEDGIKKK